MTAEVVTVRADVTVAEAFEYAQSLPENHRPIQL